MSYYHTCPICGANLDPGERCDCQKTISHPAASNGQSLPQYTMGKLAKGHPLPEMAKRMPTMGEVARRQASVKIDVILLDELAPDPAITRLCTRLRKELTAILTYDDGEFNLLTVPEFEKKALEWAYACARRAVVGILDDFHQPIGKDFVVSAMLPVQAMGMGA